MPTTRLVPEDVYQQLPDGRPVEELYSQVVSATGTRHVHVSGTVSLDTAGDVVGVDDMSRQVQQTLANIRASLANVDAAVSDVVRIKIYTVDVPRYVDEGGPELIDFFGKETMPSSTLLGVDELAHPDLLVEIEATAITE
jgi:enamine deaminase RidA (YjgF/YER057c/UK114 family)